MKYFKKRTILLLIAVFCTILVAISLWLHLYDFKKWQYFNRYSFENLKSIKKMDQIDPMLVPNFFHYEGQRLACLAKYVQNFDDTKIGWISDIHADKFKRRTVDSGTIYPKRYGEYLNKVFDDLSDEGIYTVISTGDNTNTSGSDYARNIEMIAQEKCMNVIWVKGNHDNSAVMNELGVFGNLQYYFTDQGNVRIIAINNVEPFKDGNKYFGGVDDTQLEWLSSVLKTDKRIIIAMHIPIFPLNLEDVVLDEYAKMENILHDNKNVKMVLSGHFHIPWQKKYNGINYYGEGALSYQGSEGAYAIINLNDFSIDYKFSK